MLKRLKKTCGRFIKILLFLSIIIVLITLIYPSYNRRVKKQHDVVKLTEKLNNLKDKNIKLASEVKRLYSSSYIENIARRDLGLIKEGEIAYIVIEKGNPSEEDQALSENAENPTEVDQLPAEEKEKKTLLQSITSIWTRLINDSSNE